MFFFFFFLVLPSSYVKPHTIVRLELLSATLKLFFQRPPEMQAMLGRLLQYFLDSEDLDPDLNDRKLYTDNS